MMSILWWVLFIILSNSIKALFCPQLSMRTIPTEFFSLVVSKLFPTQCAPQYVCVPPSNVTGRLAMALNQWPKSHHEVIIIFSGASVFIFVRALYHSSFTLGTELKDWLYPDFIGSMSSSASIANIIICVTNLCNFNSLEIQVEE